MPMVRLPQHEKPQSAAAPWQSATSTPTRHDLAAAEGFHYSDTGYILVGLIIEKVSGSTYYQELSRRFLRPLNLSHTTPLAQKRQRVWHKVMLWEARSFPPRRRKSWTKESWFLIRWWNGPAASVSRLRLTWRDAVLPCLTPEQSVTNISMRC